MALEVVNQCILLQVSKTKDRMEIISSKSLNRILQMEADTASLTRRTIHHIFCDRLRAPMTAHLNNSKSYLIWITRWTSSRIVEAKHTVIINKKIMIVNLLTARKVNSDVDHRQSLNKWTKIKMETYLLMLAKYRLIQKIVNLCTPLTRRMRRIGI
jgi:hypothetical protein